MADQHVIRGTSLATAVPEDTTIQDFKARLRGVLLRPGETGYEDARKVWNGMIVRKPALIAA